MTDKNDNTAAGGKSAIQRFAPLLVIAAALIGFFATGLHEYFSLDTLREHRETMTAWVEASPYLAIGLFVLVYAGAVAISFPGASILTIFGGFLFGLWPGVPAIVTGATIGAFIIFVAAKSAFADLLGSRASGFAKKMEEGFREDELSYMFLLRIMPVFPFWGVNIGAGLAGVSARNFILGTFFGIIPGTFVYASIGNAAGAAFDAGSEVSLSGILFKPETILPILGLAVLALIPIIVKRFKGTPNEGTTNND